MRKPNKRGVPEGKIRSIFPDGTESHLNPTELIQELDALQKELRIRNEAITAIEGQLRAKTEELLRFEEETELRTHAMRKALFEDAPDGYLVTDPDGVIQDVNRAAERILGRSAENLKQRRLCELLPAMAIRGALPGDSNQTYRWEGAVYPKPGRRVWVAVASSASRDDAGKVTCLTWLIRDITERKQTEDALCQSEGLLRMFIDHAPAALVMFDREMRCIDVNPGWLSQLKVQKSEVLGRIHYDVFPQVPERWRDAHRRGLAGEVVRSEGVDSFTLADGSVIWAEWEVRPWYDAAGQVAGIVIYSNDVTERKKAESELRRSEARLKLAINAANAGTWEWDLRTNTFSWSPEKFRLIGLDPNRTKSPYDAWMSIMAAEDRPRVEKTMAEAARLKADLNFEWRVSQHEGNDRWFMSRARPVLDNSGKVVRYYGIVLDITERKQMEIQLRQSSAELELRVEERTRELSRTVKTLNERSEQLRQMTAELTLVEQRERQRLAQILHDVLQQILVGAKYRLAFAARTPDLRHDLDPVVELIDDAIETSRSLSAELSPPVLIKGDLIAALKWLARWMGNKYKLKVHLTSREQIPHLPDEVLLLLFQAARELLFNVVKHAGVDSAGIEVGQADGVVNMQIRDEGCGFDQSRLRGEGGQAGGTGLLGVSERLTYLGGHLEIDSSPGRGSRFKLTVPLSGRTLGADQTSIERWVQISVPLPQRLQPRGPVDKKKIRVMLADDHMVVRQGLAGLIRSEDDFEVAGEASDGESAVKLAREIWPDVILMDISMPGMDGIQATKIIHRDLPEVRVIGLSMFQDEEQRGAMYEAGALKFLSKSAPSEGLIEAIRSCVEGNASRSGIDPDLGGGFC